MPGPLDNVTVSKIQVARTHETTWHTVDVGVLPVPARAPGEATHWKPTHVRAILHDVIRPSADTSTAPLWRMNVVVQGEPMTAKGEALPQHVALIIRWYSSFSDAGKLTDTVPGGESGLDQLPEAILSMVGNEFPEFWRAT